MAGYPVKVYSGLLEYIVKAKSSRSEHECGSTAPWKLTPGTNMDLEK